MSHAPKVIAALLAALALAGPLAADEADDRYRFLAGLIDKGLHELAVEEAEGFLKDHPRHPKADLARYRLASALFALDRLEDARPHYQELSRRKSFEYRAECLFRAAQCSLAAERLEEARGLLEQVILEEQDYLHPAALYLLGECAQRLGELEEARTRYEELIQSAPQTEHAQAARRALVWVAWQERKVEDTVRLARQYLQRHGSDPDSDEVRVLSGEALLELGRPSEALEAYRSVGEGAAFEAALRGTGYALAALEAHAEAAAAFDRLLERFPRGRFADEAKLQRGVQRIYAGDLRGAEKSLAAANTSDPEVLFWLARAQEENGNQEAALQTLERAVAARPDAELTTRINVARGALLQKLGRTDAALAAYENADSEYGLAAAAVAGLNEGDLETAGRLASRLLERHPQSAYRLQAVFVLGETAFQAGDYASARERFAEVVAAPEDDAQAARGLSRLGWCDYLGGEPAAAARSFERVVREHAGAAEAEEASFMLGRSLEDAGETARAAAAWRSYLERYPAGTQRAEALFSLAEILGDDGGGALFETLVSEHRDSQLAPRALFEIAEKASAAGDPDRAAQAYEDLLALSPRGELADRSRYGLAWILHDRGLSKRALPLLADIEATNDADPALRRAALELAIWANAAAGDPEEAERFWRAFVQSSDDDRERYSAARRVAEAWREAGRVDRARALFEELLRSLSDPEVAVDVLVEGTFAALDEGDLDRAEAQVRVADRQEVGADRVAEAAFFVAEARFEAGENERAIELYEKAGRSQSPYADDALYKLGFARLRQEQLEEAALAFDALVQGHGESELLGESLFLFGETCYRMGRYEDALNALARLRREKPRHQVIAKALFRYGLSAGRLERWTDAEEALALLAKEHEDFPNVAEAELWRGKALAAQRKARAARQAFDRVVGLDRGALAAEARLGIGQLLRDEGRTEDALAEFLKVAVLYDHPEHVPAALIAAGECLEAQGDAARARERYKEVLQDYPDSSHAERARAALLRIESQ